jgi:hypothetical protein
MLPKVSRRMYSASALAANTLVRSAVAAAFPLFTIQMFHKVRPIFQDRMSSRLISNIISLEHNGLQHY